MEKDLRTAAKTNNSSRVKRLKESLNSMEGEKVQFSERKALHMKELEVLQKRREQVDKELHAGGITQLPTIQQRSKYLPCVHHTPVMCYALRL